jgi:hypothetical protein
MIEWSQDENRTKYCAVFMIIFPLLDKNIDQNHFECSVHGYMGSIFSKEKGIIQILFQHHVHDEHISNLPPNFQKYLHCDFNNKFKSMYLFLT